MNSNVKISVCINTFNHQKTIGETIESVISQKTDFKFEVVIFDDFSTDDTRSIIRSYSVEYPELVRYIFKECNLFSINGHLPFIECWNAAKGQYIALCEGDDYWIDPYKLQKQYDAVKEFDVDICFTNAYMEYSNGHRKEYFVRQKKNKHVSMRDVIRSGGGGMPTASILISAGVLQNLPEWFKQAPVGDYFVQILGAKRNGAAYLADITTVYRVATSGSWSARRLKISDEKILGEYEGYFYVFDSLMKSDSLMEKTYSYALSREVLYLAVLAFRKKRYSLASFLLGKSWEIDSGFNSRKIIWSVIVKLTGVVLSFGNR